MPEVVAKVPPPERHYGHVKWFDPKKGFGFIVPKAGDRDIFFHSTELKKSGWADEPDEGEPVSYLLAVAPKGFKAVAIKREAI